MPELVLELFSEEIPARMQARAAADLERLVNERLLAAGFLPEGVKAFAGPRRLALVASGLPARQPDRREEKKGPRVGAPEKAVEGFLKSAGLASLDQCQVRDDKKGQFYVALIEENGRDTATVIAGFVPEVIAGFPWPKSMRWGEGELKWVRPLHSVLCCFDGEVVDFEIDGVKSSDRTYGHRFMAPDEIRVRSFDKYFAALKRAHVLFDAEERKALIAGEAKTLCEAQGLELVEDAGLLSEVSGLAEWPVVMIGSFDEKFLALPDEVLTATMRGHQKYFSVRDPKSGRLANKFVFVANLEAPDGGAAMRAGYERVLTARLSDAWYLYHQDLKVPLAERIKDLDRVTFFEGLGSVGDKARRLNTLAFKIGARLETNPNFAASLSLESRSLDSYDSFGEPAWLAKADLVSAMVHEFPELQGAMGRYYFIEQNRGAGDTERLKEIADAIRDHYKPAGADDDVPTAPVSVAVALADKIDTLTAFWSIGKKPTGSSDPFALRRAALGVIRILLENELRLSLATAATVAFREGAECGVISEGNNGYLEARKREHDDAVDKADRKKGTVLVTLSKITYESDDLVADLLAFFHDRLKVYLRDKGHKYDAIDAVLAKADGSLEDDLVLIVRKLEALEAFLKTDDGVNLASGFKRAANILKAEEKKDGKSTDPSAADARLLALAEEKALFAALEAVESKAGTAVAGEKFEDAMAALASLRAPIDAFFDKVTVNDPDPKLRANRLALLARFRAATATVADLSKLEG